MLMDQILVQSNHWLIEEMQSFHSQPNVKYRKSRYNKIDRVGLCRIGLIRYKELISIAHTPMTNLIEKCIGRLRSSNKAKLVLAHFGSIISFFIQIMIEDIFKANQWIKFIQK